MKAWALVIFSMFAVHGAAGQALYTTDNASPANPPVVWTPTPVEEEIRWHLNRGRYDTIAENVARLSVHTGLPASAGPLAPHYSLTAAARRHSEDLARRNLFQHETVIGSAYYNPVTHPTPMARMVFEGYRGVTATNENVTAGRATALEAYLSWWNSALHRTAMFGGNMREVGVGHFHLAGSRWGQYHTMDLAVAGSNHFFTGTIFHDSNGNLVYNSGEGRAGIRIDLLANGSAHSHFDISTSVGSFAVPLSKVPSGSNVEVRLTNVSGSPATLSIPLNHAALAELQLGPGQMHSWGTFKKAANTENVGFRNLTLATRQPTTAPHVKIQVRDEIVTLSWLSQAGYLYQPRWTTNFRNWQNLGDPLLGNGTTLSTADLATSPPRYYQIAVFAIP